MTDRTIHRPDGIPAPGGHYSPAVSAGGFLFTAGQTGGDPATGELAGTFAGQVRQALTNFVRVLEDGGSRPDLLVKTLCFLSSPDDFVEFNEIYREFFPENPPARSTVGVAFPGDVRFEIEGIALLAPVTG